MQAYELISKTIESIHPEENGRTALDMMDQFRVHHLAIVKNRSKGASSEAYYKSINVLDDSFLSELIKSWKRS